MSSFITTKGTLTLIKEETTFNTPLITDATLAVTPAGANYATNEVIDLGVTDIQTFTFGAYVDGTDYTLDKANGLLTVLLPMNGVAAATASVTYYNIGFTADNYVEGISMSLTPNVETVDRTVLISSFINKAPVVVRNTASGTMNLELIGKDLVDDLNGDVLFKNACGVKESGGVGTGALIGVEAKSTTPVAATLGTEVINTGDTDIANVYVVRTVSGVTTIATVGDHYAVNATTGVVTLADTGTFWTDAASTATVYYTIAGSSVLEVDAPRTGDATLYKLAQPTDTVPSLAVKQWLGGSEDDCMLITGAVCESMNLNFVTAGICNVDFSVAGCGFDETLFDQVKPTVVCLDTDPYVGKLATVVFKVNGVSQSFDITDLSFSLTNEIRNVDNIQTEGYGAKITTAKDIMGSFTFMLKDLGLITAMKRQQDCSIYAYFETNTHECAVSMPAVRISSFNPNYDDSGLMSASVEFKGFSKCSSGTQPFLLGSKAK